MLPDVKVLVTVFQMKSKKVIKLQPYINKNVRYFELPKINSFHFAKKKLRSFGNRPKPVLIYESFRGNLSMEFASSLCSRHMLSTLSTLSFLPRPHPLWSGTAKNTEVLGHSPICLLLRLHCSLILLLHTARFACALYCAHSLPSSWGRGFCLW